MDPFDLQRFVAAQARDYDQAVAELRAGHKRSHWIWYVFPQLMGLGHSRMSEMYGIASRAEARAYLAHPVLGTRLKECVAAITAHPDFSAREILGDVDALKFHSCLTLFAAAAPGEPLFTRALTRFFGDEPDGATLARLSEQGEAPTAQD